jgi:hypothetical protein
MLGTKFLSRPQWERKLKKIGAEPVQGATALNSAEWWRVPGKLPFVVPVEDDGSCEYWAIQRICKDQGDGGVYRGWLH